MKDKSIDVYVYVQDNNGTDALARIQARLGRIAGIVQTRMNQYVRPLMAVKYNPDEINSHAIIRMIRQEGCNASLVGM